MRHEAETKTRRDKAALRSESTRWYTTEDKRETDVVMEGNLEGEMRMMPRILLLLLSPHRLPENDKSASFTVGGFQTEEPDEAEAIQANNH